MNELVTGDAVVLDLRPARLPSRAIAVFIDLLLAWFCYLAMTLALLTATASLDDAATAAIQVALFVLVLVGAPIAVETLSRGRSVGKVMCGLRVVREDGGPIRFRHALVRGAIGVVEIQALFGVPACTASLVSARGRRLGDVFAGTLVVRERMPGARDVSVPPAPEWIAGRFGELDLSRVPDGLWLAIRQYLMRAGQLDAAIGESMALRLAADLTAWTGVQPPEGIPAAAYLAGVVAERQAREIRRAFGGRGGGDPWEAGEKPLQQGAFSVYGPSGASAREEGVAPLPAVTPAATADPSGQKTGGAAGQETGGAAEQGARSTGFVPPL